MEVCPTGAGAGNTFRPRLLEQAPRSPEYVPDPIELEDHVPVYIPEPDHPEDLVLAEDVAPTPPLPPFFLSPRIRPPRTRAAMAQMRATTPSTYHPLLPSGTPPLLPIPLPAPSTSRRADIPEADTPPWKRLLLTTPRPSCRFRDTERRMMTALEMVNMRVSYQVDVRSRESSEFYSRHHNAQKDRAAVRAEIEVLRRERLAYEQESMETRQALARSEAYCRALEARLTVLETELADGIDLLFCLATQYRSFVQKMAPKRRTTRLNPYTTPTRVKDTHTTTSVTNAQIQAMINEGITTALAARDATRNGDDSHTSGTGVRRPVQVARECTYPDFLKCQPLNFKGTEGVVGLTQWFEKLESVYSISNCTIACQTTTPEAAYAMPWRILKKMMTDKYCLRGEIKKLEFEMWNLKVKGNDVVTYSQRFQELALMCDRMFLEESDKVEKYVSGLPDMIHGTKNKRKLDNNNQAQQQLPKRQNVVQVYAAKTGERKEYAGTLPLCNKCKFHHNGPCTVKCANCKRVGHLTRGCWSYAATNNQRTLTCYECGNQGHYRSDCPKLKNGNQARGTETGGRVPALAGGETNQDLDDKEDNTNA
ncbi:putative reverse transcriptase domain-containing protein [Tanacetum coccineum]